MTISVNTNKPALIALQNLNKTNDDLSETQNRINTGLKIASAKDNASVYAIAQKQRAYISALGAVTTASTAPPRSPTWPAPPANRSPTCSTA